MGGNERGCGEAPPPAPTARYPASASPAPPSAWTAVLSHQGSPIPFPSWSGPPGWNSHHRGLLGSPELVQPGRTLTPPRPPITAQKPPTSSPFSPSEPLPRQVTAQATRILWASVSLVCHDGWKNPDGEEPCWQYAPGFSFPAPGMRVLCAPSGARFPPQRCLCGEARLPFEN